MSKVYIMDHPLIHHKLAILRDKETPVKCSEKSLLKGRR